MIDILTMLIISVIKRNVNLDVTDCHYAVSTWRQTQLSRHCSQSADVNCVVDVACLLVLRAASSETGILLRYNQDSR